MTDVPQHPHDGPWAAGLDSRAIVLTPAQFEQARRNDGRVGDRGVLFEPVDRNRDAR